MPINFSFLATGGDMGARIRAHDWSRTPLGAVETWPQSLRTAVSMVIASRFPACLVWGPRLVTLYNDAFRPILGAKPEALGRPFSEVWAEAWPVIGPIAARAFAGEATFIEDFPLIVERSGSPEEAFFTFCYSPVRDETGDVAGFLDIVVETTANVIRARALRASEDELRRLNETLEARVADRTAELLAAEAHLRQAQKMEAVGQLTSGLAHDFNNVLTAIIGNLELIEARVTDEQTRRRVAAAASSAQRGASLTGQLLAFSRRQHLSPRPIDLNGAVIGMGEMLRRTLTGSVEVQWTLADDLWPAFVDATQIEVAIVNLAINARDAMPHGGILIVGTRNVGADETDRPDELAPGDYVALSVADRGEGMTPDILAKAFEPFFTTKEVGKGTGLGLSQVYGLARQSGGTVRIRSEPGAGTEVEIFLPRALGTAAAERPQPQGEKTATTIRRRRTVLVADDEKDVREIVAVHLEALGYGIAEAADGRAALDLLNGGGAAMVEALVVDYAMPEMSGAEVIRLARLTRPDLPVVLMTGYADAEVLDEHLPHAALLKKPFRRLELAAALDAAAAPRRRRQEDGDAVAPDPPRN